MTTQRSQTHRTHARSSTIIVKIKKQKKSKSLRGVAKHHSFQRAQSNCFAGAARARAQRCWKWTCLERGQVAISTSLQRCSHRVHRDTFHVEHPTNQMIPLSLALSAKACMALDVRICKLRSRDGSSTPHWSIWRSTNKFAQQMR